MIKINNINRRKFLEIFGGCTWSLMISACSTAPITHRKQLKLLPETSLNRQAAQIYENVKMKTKLSDDKKQLKEIEEIVKKYWDDIDIKKYISDKYSDKEPIAFVEGPPTLNGNPHIGHIRGRIIKDVWYRFNVLNNRNVIFRGGWDTQGLPVELQAEKELGLTGSKIENLKKIVVKMSGE